MSINLIGIIAALTTFFSIWIGHVAVRKIEAKVVSIWPAMLISASAGIICEIIAFRLKNETVAAALAIIGITLCWDSFEFWRQQKRIIKGHAPANPDNPRHAGYLEIFERATTIDYLEYGPVGRLRTIEELQQIQEGAE